MPDGTNAMGGTLLFNRKYDEYKRLTEDFIIGRLPSFDTEGQKRLGEAMRYSVSAGGKRIRGVLSLAVCELLNGDLYNILPLAGAIEYIHAYSLIHDDMPCMDDDDFRRGKPSCHKVYGEGIAMLAGDALLNLAFEVLLEKASRIPRENNGKSSFKGVASAPFMTLTSFVKASAFIAGAAGSSGMAGGQAVDLLANTADEESLSHMHMLKTGRLFRAAVLAPAICCGAGEDEYNALNCYGAMIGLAFQIKDDLVDFEGGGADNETMNYAKLFGESRARLRLAEICSEAKKSLGVFDRGAGFLNGIAEYISTG
jgi:geranylgeranyl diphosphate synthase type II